MQGLSRELLPRLQQRRLPGVLALQCGRAVSSAHVPHRRADPGVRDRGARNRSHLPRWRGNIVRHSWLHLETRSCRERRREASARQLCHCYALVACRGLLRHKIFGEAAAVADERAGSSDRRPSANGGRRTTDAGADDHEGTGATQRAHGHLRGEPVRVDLLLRGVSLLADGLICGEIAS